MPKLIGMERISLKNNPEINEVAVQEYIFEHPDVLGLGNLTPRQREKSQASGGRLDILLADEDNDARYEVEVQLGSTDPSHIIRTIEYWDNERKKYPSYDHVAVIVAEEITGRFMNVISLFNGAIPLIAYKISAYKMGDGIHIDFIKVLDRVTRTDDEDDAIEQADRSYWEKASTKNQMALFDNLFERLSEYTPGLEPKYNKMYIGVSKDGIARNFVYFKPHKSFVAMFIKTRENNIENMNFDELNIDYMSRGNKYRVRFTDIKEFDKNKDLLYELINGAKELFNIED